MRNIGKINFAAFSTQRQFDASENEKSHIRDIHQERRSAQ
jgi:hypothetical protein